MRTPRKQRTIFLILLLLVLLPALFYSAYEINALSTQEEIISGIYRQQLAVVLFSINQYAWDVVSTWASSLTVLSTEARLFRGGGEEALAQFFERNQAVQAVFQADSAGRVLMLLLRGSDSAADGIEQGEVERALRAERDLLERLGRYKRVEYRKLEPVLIGDTSTAEHHVACVFALGAQTGSGSIAGIVLDQEAFVNTILAPKMREVAASDFVIAVIHQGMERVIFSTGRVDPSTVKQRRKLWLFPQYALGVRLVGETIEDVARSRFSRNLLLILLLDAVLVAGVWVVYRNVRREMELAKIKSDFVSNVSHELRTPLSLIRMFAETLEMGRLKTEEKKREYHRTILRETERLSRLVNNILSFSRMEAGRKQYHFRDVSLNAIVDSVMSTYESHLRDHGFSPVVELGENLPMIHADEEAVTEALINIIDNAVKYSDREKYIRVRTGRASNGNVFVDVEDHGIGIAPEHHKKIFETFYRVSSGLVHNTKGSGLGLALVKHILQGHGGTVTLRSSPGVGSTFRLEFPLTPDHAHTGG